MLKLTPKPFTTHKEAENPEDNQDALHLNHLKGRYAVADGATRSFFPKEWAVLLVRHFCDSVDFSLNSKEDVDLRAWLAPIQKKWYEQIEEKVIEQNVFYLTNAFNMKESAVSTFIGIEFNITDGEWMAMIVGDSCLFHKSDSEFESYPIKNSADFTNQPENFASFPKDNYSEPLFASGLATSGDTFILATDALAKWILEHKEIGKLDLALNTLQAIESVNEFHQFVDNARHENSIRLINDDVTLMVISVKECVEPLDECQMEQHTSSEDSKIETKLFRVLLLTLVAVFFGFAGFFYILRYLFYRD